MLLIRIKSQHQPFCGCCAGVHKEMDVLAVSIRRRRQRNPQYRKVSAFPVIVNPVFIFIKRKFIFPESRDIYLFKNRVLQIDRGQKGDAFPVFRLQRKGHLAGCIRQRFSKARAVCRLPGGPAEPVILWQFLQKGTDLPAGADHVFKAGQRYLPFPVQTSRFFRYFCQGQETAGDVAVILYGGFRRDGLDFLPQLPQSFAACFLQYIRQEFSVICIIVSSGKLYHCFRRQFQNDFLQGLGQKCNPAFGFFPSVQGDGFQNGRNKTKNRARRQGCTVFCLYRDSVFIT